MNFVWVARVWSQQAIVNTELMPYLGQPFCYFISISFTHSSSIFWFLAIMSLGTIFPQFLWFTHFSLNLPLRFFLLHLY